MERETWLNGKLFRAKHVHAISGYDNPELMQGEKDRALFSG